MNVHGCVVYANVVHVHVHVNVNVNVAVVVLGALIYFPLCSNIKLLVG